MGKADLSGLESWRAGHPDRAYELEAMPKNSRISFTFEGTCGELQLWCRSKGEGEAPGILSGAESRATMAILDVPPDDLQAFVNESCRAAEAHKPTPLSPQRSADLEQLARGFSGLAKVVEQDARNAEAVASLRDSPRPTGMVDDLADTFAEVNRLTAEEGKEKTIAEVLKAFGFDYEAEKKAMSAEQVQPTPRVEATTPPDDNEGVLAEVAAGAFRTESDPGEQRAQAIRFFRRRLRGLCEAADQLTVGQAAGRYAFKLVKQSIADGDVTLYFGSNDDTACVTAYDGQLERPYTLTTGPHQAGTKFLELCVLVNSPPAPPAEPGRKYEVTVKDDPVPDPGSPTYLFADPKFIGGEGSFVSAGVVPPVEVAWPANLNELLLWLAAAASAPNVDAAEMLTFAASTGLTAFGDVAASVEQYLIAKAEAKK